MSPLGRPDEAVVLARLCSSVSAIKDPRHPVGGNSGNYGVGLSFAFRRSNHVIVLLGGRDHARLVVRKSHPTSGLRIAQGFNPSFGAHGITLRHLQLTMQLDARR